MVAQLRVYRIKAAGMEDWMREWRDDVRPLREHFGFSVLGAWVAVDQDTFIWILAHEDFEAADAAYYGSPERRALDPDPARHILDASTWLMAPLPAVSEGEPLDEQADSD